MTQPSFEFEAAHWEAAYQGRPPVAGLNAWFDTPPWDIGEPQPVVVALADSGMLSGEVLDIGCGPGNNAVFLAERGDRVTGIDWARTALQTARQRAQAHGVAVEFVHADATTLQGVPQRFNVVLDSALYICSATPSAPPTPRHYTVSPCRAPTCTCTAWPIPTAQVSTSSR